MAIKEYSKLLRVRSAAKKIQQLSWTVSQLEKRYDIKEMDEREYPDLIEAYLATIPQVKIILDELLAEEK